MAGQLVHFEIPAGDIAKAREFWGSLFGWQFEAYPGPTDYHMARVTDESGVAIYDPDPPSKRGTRAYFDVDDINAGTPASQSWAARPARRCRFPAWAGSRSARTPRGTSSASGKTIPRLPRRRARTATCAGGAVPSEPARLRGLPVSRLDERPTQAAR